MVEYLSNSKKIESRKLYEEVFPEDSKEFLDYYFNSKIKDHKVLVKRIQNDVVGMLHCNPHLLSINGEKEEIEYIYAVATKKDYRKQGIMKELLEKVLNDMHEEGKPFTYLIPVAEKIYAPYGFAYVSDNYKMTIERRDILKAASLITVSLDDINSTEAINELKEFTNELLQKEVSIYSYRNPSYYRDIINQLKIANGQIELLYIDNRLQGYCYMTKEGQGNIQEIICDEDDIEFFVQTILDKYDMDKITVGGTLTRQKSYSGGHELFSQKKGFIMSRILNLQKFFSYITSEGEIELVMEITDPIIKENNGVFLWKCNKSASVIEKTIESPEFNISISDLTAWLFGYSKEFKGSAMAIKTFTGVYINEEV